MTVTYAWKIDDQLYAYLVNNKFLDNAGNLLDEYNNEESRASFMGVLYTERLSEAEERKVYLYCKNNFGTHSESEFEEYKKFFDSMLFKIRDYAYPSYFYVSLFPAKTYFYIDEDCEELADGACCYYDPNNENVSECNRHTETETTKYTVGGIPAGTPLSELSGLSINEVFNIMFFGNSCNEDIFVEPDVLDVPATGANIFVEPDVLNIPAVGNIFVEPDTLEVASKKER